MTTSTILQNDMTDDLRITVSASDLHAVLHPQEPHANRAAAHARLVTALDALTAGEDPINLPCLDCGVQEYEECRSDCRGWAANGKRTTR